MLEQLLAFLLAFMPASDRAEYDPQFFEQCVQESIIARQNASWQIPDSIFNHFVLPPRVNNENLDHSRTYFLHELSPLVAGKSMREAVLEVNHWCHAHVTYQPSDARTSSPMATLCTAWGRCGEESTFLVSALRAVAIPARQVYTPRWAHTDDNHAWVEAWVDGEWCFLGACEPEPVLNLGWFNAPASRGLLMHTKVFGNWNGPEDVMSRTHQYTEINVINNYAQCARATVQVQDTQGHPVENATVLWQIYNYAEFYPVLRHQTGTDGLSSLSAGLGDMLVTAYKDSCFGYAKVDFRAVANAYHQQTPVVVVLSHTIGQEFDDDITIVPPAEHSNLPYVSDEMRAENNRRMANEDQQRLAYRASFPTLHRLPQMGITDSLEQQFVLKSEGNYQTIINFITENSHTPSTLTRATALLSTLTDKDLRDVPISVLHDHLKHTSPLANTQWVLSPRISNERLTPWRQPLQQAMGKRFMSGTQIAGFCRDSIALIDSLTSGGTYMTPMAMWRTRTADSKSLPILFVAMCRAAGISAWYDSVTGNTFYLEPTASEPTLVTLHSNEDLEADTYRTAFLTLEFEKQPYVSDPEYLRHYTLSRFDGNKFSLLDYDDFIPLSQLYGTKTQVEAGYYLLTTGQRMADGSVRAHVSCFNIPEGSHTHHKLTLHNDQDAVSVIGSFNSEARYSSVDGRDLSVLQTTGRGYFVVGLLGVGQEPTNHALNDIALRRNELEAWGRTLLLLFPSRADYDRYMDNPIAGLPKNVVFGIDDRSQIATSLREGMKLQAQSPLPYFIVGDTFNRVVFESHGYTIGLGNAIVKTILSL